MIVGEVMRHVAGETTRYRVEVPDDDGRVPWDGVRAWMWLDTDSGGFWDEIRRPGTLAELAGEIRRRR